MARDIVGLLTGISGTQQPMQPQQPVAGTAGFRGMFGAQQAQGLAGGLERIARQGAPSNQERMQEAMSKLDLGSVDGLTTLAKLQQIQGDLAGATQTVAQIKQLQQEKQKQILNVGQQEALVKYLETNYPSFAEAAKGATPLITADNWKDFKEKVGSTKNQFGGTKLVKDEANNLYYVTQSLDPDSEGAAPKSVFSPLTPGAPAEPTTAVTVVGDSGETPEERKAREISTSTGKTVGKGFAQLQTDALKGFSEAQEAVYTSDRLIDIVDKIDTGGFKPVFAKALTDFLGITAGDIGEFEYLVKNKMIQKLRAFGANPTEGERKAADEMVESLKKSQKVNLAQLQAYKKEMERRAARQEFLLQDDITKKQYKDFVNAQYENKEPTENVVVWGARK